MNKIVAVFLSNSFSNKCSQDTFVDRLSSTYTVHILAAFAILVFAQVYVGSPINCWTPAEFKGSHNGYTESFCYVTNTYYNPDLKPLDTNPDDQKYIPYYQWIPFILVGMAIFFYLPKLFWGCTNQKVGIDADDILQAAYSCDVGSKIHDRDNNLKNLVYQFDRCMTFHPKIKQRKSSTLMLFLNGGYGNYLCLIFIISKILYLSNIMMQFVALNWVLAVDFHSFGLEAFRHFIEDIEWSDTKVVAFPRVTYCDLDVRKVGQNTHNYTIQCTLPMNMYNEKIFLFMWCWFIFLFIATIIDLTTWLMRLSHDRDKRKFIRNHLDILLDGLVEKKEIKVKVKHFVEDYLKPDGVFLLQLISHNCNKKTVTDICSALWKNWEHSKKIISTEETDMMDTIT